MLNSRRLLALFDCGEAYSKDPHDEDSRIKAQRFAALASDSTLVLKLLDDILDESVSPNLELANINV